MRIEDGIHLIDIEFIGRASDGINVWRESENDTNSIEISLLFSVEDSAGISNGMCIQLQDIADVYHGLLSLLQKNSTVFQCSRPFPFKNYFTKCNEEFFFISVQRLVTEISFTFRIHDGLCDYAEVTELMSEAKFYSIVSELKEIYYKYHLYPLLWVLQKRLASIDNRHTFMVQGGSIYG